MMIIDRRNIFHWLPALLMAGGVLVAIVVNHQADRAAMATTILQAQEQKKKSYYGLSSCLDCHNRKDAYVNKDNPAICDCREMKIWLAKDKHKIAFRVLTQARAQRMGKLLGIADVTIAKQCVSCHGVWIEPADKQFISRNFNTRQQKVDQGISCVACHGPYSNWIVRHGSPIIEEREKWRKKSRLEKERDFGMTDLWNPVKRARLCASCHVGNVEQDKVVTHDMYAAGHPPLPSFEPATFCDEMPHHWQYLKDKKKSVLALLNLDNKAAALEQTNLLAAGTLVVYQSSLRMLAAQTGSPNWPELAQFDCYACHHELRSKSWRQHRKQAGRPGRPRPRQWPASLVELGLSHLAADDGKASRLTAEFAMHQRALQHAFDQQPFGDRAQVKKAAERAAKWIQQRLDPIEKHEKHYEHFHKTPQQLLARLHALRKESVPDYDAARQLSWAMTILRGESDTKSSPRKSQTWQALNQYMGLRFPEGQVSIEPTLNANLQRVGNYEPNRFFSLFDAALIEYLKSR